MAQQVDDGSAGVDPAPLQVPGYRTERMLGFGGTGEVWAARDDSDDSACVLKLLRPGADPDRLADEVAVLRRIDHPHVVRMRAVRDVPGRGLVVVLDHAAGGSITGLVAARGPLDPGEVVTIVAPLAQALADLHARGVIHGDVSPGNVLLSGDGRPLLTDLGLARAIGAPGGEEVAGTEGFVDPAVRFGGESAAAAGDVYGLAAVAWFALVGVVPPEPQVRPPLATLCPHLPVAVREAVEAGLAADPADRPDPATFGRSVYQAAAAAPVRVVAPGWREGGLPPELAVTHRIRREARQDSEATADTGRSAGRRWGLLVLAAVVVTASVGVAGWATDVPGRWLGSDPGSDTAVAGPSTPEPAGSRPSVAEPVEPAVEGPAVEGPAVEGPAAQDPAPSEDAVLAGDDLSAVVQVLADRRARAFAAADPTLAEQVAAPGSVAFDQDQTALVRLRAEGVRYDGLTFEVTAATVQSQSPAAAQVRVVVDASGYRQLREDGTSTEVTAEPGQASLLTLVRVDGAWRVELVS